MMPNHPQHDATAKCDGTAAKRFLTSQPDKALLAFCQNCQRFICECEYREGHICWDPCGC